MSDQSIPDEPPEQTEIYEQYDEVAESGSTGRREDPGATGVTGAEEDLTRFTEQPVDEVANEEIGATLDDPEQMALIDGGMDDPDGINPSELRDAALSPDGPHGGRSEDDGWDLDAGEEPRE